MIKTQKHFSKIAGRYGNLRTTDAAPIASITGRLQTLSKVCAADVGCGQGRYDLKLFEHLGESLNLFGVDGNRTMLQQAVTYLRRHGIRAFQTVEAYARDLPFEPASLDCILTFNAVHHFNVVRFLNESARILKDGGYLFIYTRLRSQNRRNIWGTHFPGFHEKETRLFELNELEEWLWRTSALQLEAIEFYQYERVSSLPELTARALEHHYSTFSLYDKKEFDAALQQFQDMIRQSYRDVSNVSWCDENVLLIARKSTAPLMNWEVV